MISQLIEKIKKTNAPICVGLDPMLSYVPEHVVKKSFDTYGETLKGAAEAIWEFNKEIIDHTWDLIPAVKPQIAMYEQFGIEGRGLLPRKGPDCNRRRQEGRHWFHICCICSRTSGQGAGGKQCIQRI